MLYNKVHFKYIEISYNMWENYLYNSAFTQESNILNVLFVNLNICMDLFAPKIYPTMEKIIVCRARHEPLNIESMCSQCW